MHFVSMIKFKIQIKTKILSTFKQQDQAHKDPIIYWNNRIISTQTIQAVHAHASPELSYYLLGIHKICYLNNIF